MLYQLSYTHHVRPARTGSNAEKHSGSHGCGGPGDHEGVESVPETSAASARAVSLSGPGAGTKTAER